MPLKIITRPGGSIFYLRGAVLGQKVYESTGTSDRSVADQIRIKRETEISREAVHGKQATRTFADAAGSYLTAELRTPATAESIRKLLLHFGATPLAKIGQDSLDTAFRALLKDGVMATPATKVRAVITPLSAVLTHASYLGWCATPRFKKPRIAATSTNFLLPAQADALIAAAAPHLRPLLTFLIGTGCRMSEALELEWSHVDLRGARARVWQKQDNERRVDLPPRVLIALRTIPFICERTGPVFRSAPRYDRAGALVRLGEGYWLNGGKGGGGQIKTAWATACRLAGLPGVWRVWTPKGVTKPKRQFVPELTPHDCRHTWASWHALIHRDPFMLKRDGGWASLAMVENYAHMIPEAYRDEAIAWLAGGAAQLRREA